MNDTIKAFAGIAFFVALIAGGIWWQVYKYGDCRHVGHTRLYCIMSLGK